MKRPILEFLVSRKLEIGNTCIIIIMVTMSSIGTSLSSPLHLPCITAITTYCGQDCAGLVFKLVNHAVNQ